MSSHTCEHNVFSTLSYLVSVSKITDDEMADYFLELSSEEEESTTIPFKVAFNTLLDYGILKEVETE